MVNKTKQLLQLATIAVLFTTLLPIRSAFAASATVSLSPASSSVTNGSTLSVGVYENSGSEAVNAASVSLSYPADKFTFVSISSSSAFSVVAASSGGNGTVHVDRGALPAVSGKQLVATVRFKAKTDSGSASVNVTSSSVLSANSNSNIAAGSSGGVYTLKPTPPPTPQAPKDTSPPKISDVSVGSVTASSAVITWTTSEPSTSEVDYGYNNSYGLAAVDNALVTNHKIILNSPIIQPGIHYAFIVKSADSSSNAASSNTSSFTSTGVSLELTVLDQKGKPLKGAKISIDNKTALSDKNGLAKLSGITVGKKSINANYRGKVTLSSIDIKPVDSKNQPQRQTIKIQTPKISGWAFITLIIILLILALLTAEAIFIKRLGLWPIIKQRLRAAHQIIINPSQNNGQGPTNQPPPPQQTT